MPVPTKNNHEFEKQLRQSNEIEITVIGRKSGRPITYPIWFAVEGGRLYLLPVKGSQTE